MRSLQVVVFHLFLECVYKRLRCEWDELTTEIIPRGSDKAFDVGIHPGGVWFNEVQFAMYRIEASAHGLDVHGVVIKNNMFDAVHELIVVVAGQFAYALRNPCTIGEISDAE